MAGNGTDCKAARLGALCGAFCFLRAMTLGWNPTVVLGPATLSTALKRSLLFGSRLFPHETTSRQTLVLFAHRVRKTCLFIGVPSHSLSRYVTTG